jgi:O-antigen/teichoic acid export membrane protein
MSVKKNIVSNFILTATTIIFPLITLPYITRTLSAVNIGKVFYIDSFTQYFILFSAIGIPYYGVREIAKLKGKRLQISEFVVELVTIQFVLSLFFSLIFLTLHLFFRELNDSSRLVKIGCIAIVSNAFLIEWFYQGIENFTYITVRSLIIKSLSVLLILFLVVQKYDFEIYYLILSLTVLANAILNFGNFIKNHFVGIKINKKVFLHLKPLWVLFSINISVSLYTIMDTIILGSLTNVEQVSFYNIPLKIVKIFWTIMGGIGIVLIPKMSAFFANNEHIQIEALIKKSISIVLLLGIPFFFMGIVFAEDILFIVSGKQYIQSKIALQILSIVPLIIGICNVFGTQFLLAIGQEKKILTATIFGFCISLVLNFLLIPTLGFIGASISCVCSESTVCLVVYLAARKKTSIQVDYGLMGLISSSVLCSMIFWLISRFYIHSILLLVLTAVVYFCSFISLHYLVFKNSLISSILKIRK